MQPLLARVFLFSFILFSNFLFATEIERGQSGTFLWDIVQKEKSLGTLFGTIHLGKEETLLPEEILKRLQNSARLITEVAITPSSEEDIEALNQLFFRSYDPEQKLRAKFDDATFTKVEELFVKAKYPVEIAATAKPWLVFMLLGYELDPEYSVEYGMEALLSQVAKEQEIPNEGLESYEVGLSAFAELPEEKLIPAIEIMLENLDELRRETTEMAQFYYQNDPLSLMEFAESGISYLNYIPAEDYKFWLKWVNNRLMIERNKAWLSKIKSWLKEGEEKKPFIAVGAAHLFGEQGLIDLLRKEGYELLPVLLELPEEERKEKGEVLEQEAQSLEAA